MAHSRKRTPQSDSNLPPPRTSAPLRSVSAPLSKTRLHTVIYALVIFSSLLSALYTYRLYQHKHQVGGWWNLALGRTLDINHASAHNLQQQHTATSGHPNSPHPVEDKINELAHALGLPPTALASAIASAVAQHSPADIISSVAAQESGPSVQVLAAGVGNLEEQSEAPEVMERVGSVMGSFVGMDEL